MGIKGSFRFISFPWQSKSVWHKRYSDYNSAAMMLDRTREKKNLKKKNDEGIIDVYYKNISLLNKCLDLTVIGQSVNPRPSASYISEGDRG